MNRIILNEYSQWQKYPISSNKWKHISTSFWSLSFLAFFLTMVPLLAQTPKFFGLTSLGGKDGNGAIIEYDINSKSLRDPAPTGFSNFAPGLSPQHNLTELNGKLYGITSAGGSFLGGVLFEYDPNTRVYLKKLEFGIGSLTEGGLTVRDGKLYGTIFGTDFRGDPNPGVIFEYDPILEIYSTKYQFNQANGAFPSGSLINVDGTLFGMTQFGGNFNKGVIFSYNPGSDTYNKIHDFNGTNGEKPFGSLTLFNNDLYGTTTLGGSFNSGVLFVVSGGDYSVLHNFIDGDSGSGIPHDGSLTVYNDRLFGTRVIGGSNDLGFVFEFDPVLRSITKYDFDGSNGSTPFGSLTLFNGKLYGMASEGGPLNFGVLYEFNFDEKLISPNYYFDKVNGNFPRSNLTSFNGKLYGMTPNGGLNDGGVIFEFEPSTLHYTKKLDFNETDGSYPTGSLINYNGKLFGTADAGGKDNLGVLFEYDPATERYTKNIDFVGDNGSGPNGALTAYNGKLYGMTAKGGRFIDHGLIYEYDPVTKTYTKQHEFDGTNGSSPQGGLTEYDGILYGMTSRGGNSGVGVLFGYDPRTRGLMLYDFDMTNGVSPRGNLTVYNGKIYGTTSGGGSGNGGVLFEFDPLSGVITEKYNFDQNNGWFPNGSLILYGDKLYGMTSQGGRPDKGVIFEYDPVTNIYISKHAFGGIDGDAAVGSLTEYNGKLYGMTSRGGVDTWGNVFEYDLRYETFVSNAEFNFSNGAVPLGSFTLFTPPPAELDLSATKEDESCPGSNGSIDLTISGASGTTVISWTGPDTYTADVEDLNNLAAGIYKVVVTDDAGATGSLEVEILLTPDTEDPIISCPDDINETVAFGETGKTISYSDPSFSDNCTGAGIELKSGFASGATFPVGETIVTYLATDAAGNTAECSFKVTIMEDADAVDPIINNCPTDITVSNDPGDCSAAVSWTAPTANDNSGSVDLVSNFEPGAVFPVGTTKVTYTATDAAGNQVTCSFDVTVADDELPVIGSVSDIDVSVPSGQTVTSVSVPEPSVSDNCSATVTGLRSDGKDLGEPFGLGETTITWSAEDPSGNDAVEVIQKVTVTQSEPPLSITGFTLINAGTDADILTVIDGLQISLNQVQGLSLNIRANTNPSVVGSVYLTISGPVNRTSTENVAPYALFGDNNGNYSGRTLPEGTYTLTARAYSASNRGGTAGILSSIQFSIVAPLVAVTGVTVSPSTATINEGSAFQLTATVFPSNATDKAVNWSSSDESVATVNENGLVTGHATGQASITATTVNGGLMASSTITVQAVPNFDIESFTLVNAGTDLDIMTVTNGLQISQSEVQGLSLNIRANTNPSVVGSVYLKLSGPVNRTTTENDAPYALFGDKNGNYSGKTLSPGTYTLTARAYSESKRRGTAGPEKTITFSIVNNSLRITNETDPAANESMEKERPGMEIQSGYSLKAFPNPVKDGRVSIMDSRFKEGKVKYILYSINGAKLTEGEAEIGEGKTIRLDFSGNVNQAGMYILILDSDVYLAPLRVQLIFE
ncbi:choice-of-anchor tandem repeat GloVer-containing protein [Aquiflexum gelatinilyticum]|uniref:choice-of-anchor tandem repeat GloVer-containing protein n=1 Tax=Aquiflexum gelatinilyticum TaxID=2961943 RepID=UPI002167DDD0|nr:choice-of-anchor tandem repeat GloVer-containing protein [Aquiflexum gelatinilyticum]MCS4435325.1 HYR domain-containing protein [Aquiflexum gelatinilyticum]